VQELGPATEHDVVLAFLQAEVDSPRFGPRVAQVLQGLRLTRALIDQPDLASAQQNFDRIRVLASYRGYRVNQALFTGFPCDTITWRRVRLGPDDFAMLRYCNEKGAPGYLLMSGGTRRVVDAAANFERIPTDATPHVQAVVAGVRAGQTYPPLVAVDSGVGDMILVEGYTRATAYGRRAGGASRLLRRLLAADSRMVFLLRFPEGDELWSAARREGISADSVVEK
jgi:hypothetical protein